MKQDNNIFMNKHKALILGQRTSYDVLLLPRRKTITALSLAVLEKLVKAHLILIGLFQTLVNVM